MSRRDPLLDERFEEIVAQLRRNRPHVSAELRMRVREVAGSEPPRRRGLAERLLPFRPRLVPALVALALVGGAVAGVALVRGAAGDGRASQEAGPASATATAEAGEALRAEPAPDAPESDAATEAAPAAGVDEAAVPPPSDTRLQNYSAELTVRVRDLDELSEATAQAMATARRLGGFVVTARYDAPSGPEGDSFLVVRVPVDRVQAAIAAYADLGTLVGQHIAIEDVQPAYDRLLERIERVQARIAEITAELRRTGLTEDERRAARARLQAAQAELRVLRDQRESTLRQARLARLSLTLTTRGPDERPAPPGDTEQTLRDALGALETVAVWLLAAAIVAVPFVALVVVGALATRRFRRRAAERLLERPGS